MHAGIACVLYGCSHENLVLSTLTVHFLPHKDPSCAAVPSNVLQALVLTHRVFDFHTVYYTVAQIQLEAEMYHQHSPCKMVAKTSACTK